MTEYIQGINDGVEYRTDIEGWVSRHGRFYGKGERAKELAQYDSITHKLCECGNKMEKMWLLCDACRDKKREQKLLKAYESAKEVEWCGDLMEAPLCVQGDDIFFFDEYDILDYCVDNRLWPHEIRLMICEPEYIKQISEDVIGEQLCEESYDHIPLEIWEALERLNKTIRDVNANKTPIQWTEGHKKKPSRKSLEQGLEGIYEYLRELYAEIDAGY